MAHNSPPASPDRPRTKSLLATWSQQPFAYVLKVIGLILLSDMVMRLIFLAYNASEGWDFKWADVPLALLVGIRFDAATLAIFSGIWLLLMALPIWKSARPLHILSFFAVLVQFAVLFVNGVDVFYYGFSSKRLSHEFFSGGEESANFTFSDVLPYAWLIAVVVLLSMGMTWYLRRAAAKVHWSKQPGALGAKLAAWAFPIVLAGALFLGFRGGFQVRPLRPANAFVTSSVFLGNVSLNSAYTIAQSMEIGNEPEVSLMPMAQAIELSRQLVRNDFDGPFLSEEYPLLRRTTFAAPERKYNVVLLIVESLNAIKLGCINGKSLSESLTPNLDTLSKRGRLYTNFFSNGARSVQSLPAILNSTPDIFERPLIGSSFETNQQWGIGNMLAQRGYETTFLCGGPNGTLGFDSFSKVSGFQHYYGRSDYPGEAPAIAGNWGLHDKQSLDWLLGLQKASQKPFLTTWFSISNHLPFDLPADCPADIAQAGLSPMNATVKYTDWALGQYFAAVAKEDWAKQTIFIVTGDHCFYFEDDPDRGDVQNFNVPLLLIGPDVAPGVDPRTGSHISILPTLIELLRLRTQYAGLGVSLLSQQNESYGIVGLSGIQTLIRDYRYLSTTFEQQLNCYQFKEGKWEADKELSSTEKGLEMNQLLRAIYQVESYIRRHNKQNLPKGMGE